MKVDAQRDVIIINEKDNVCVALREIKKGEVICTQKGEITAWEDIPSGHKMALCDVSRGEAVIKYGEPIGEATGSINKGMHVHVHNLKTLLNDKVEYSYCPTYCGDCQAEKPCCGDMGDMEALEDSFFGYLRENGQVGIRNEIWIVPTVGCVNDVALNLERMAKSEFEAYGINPDVTIHAFTHPYGCSQLGDDQNNTRTILADLITHPNAGGVLVLGLGCENSNIEVLKGYLGEYDSRRVKFLVAQEVEDEIEEGLNILRKLYEKACGESRVKVPVSKLVIGLKCGGSDGFSGITANPLVGRLSDILISRGGSTILTEVPEMFGAEHLLMNRCANEKLFGDTVKLINDFKDYYKRNNQVIYENPSPGNKKGGISTLEDKSLGCTQKSGSTLVKGVLSYGERLSCKGLNLLSAPGNDLIASTALAASGAQLVLFTTGRGTPFSSPVPTVKISSNSALFERKRNWIDFDAGEILSGKSIEELGEELYIFVLEVAEGKQLVSEKSGYRDFAIFKQGVTL